MMDDEDFNESMHMMNEVCFDELLFEVSLKFHTGTQFVSRKLGQPIPSRMDEMSEENRHSLINHALELITNNVNDFDTVQVWIEEENILIFLLVARDNSIPEEVEVDFIGNIPPENSVIIDAQPYSDYGGEPSNDSVYRYFNRI
tara:strand:+ start:2662 stop:3093 length:432 start_codon:yes stop_codon:yes gene_type:complete